MADERGGRGRVSEGIQEGEIADGGNGNTGAVEEGKRSITLKEAGWCDENAIGRTNPLGMKEANGIGLTCTGTFVGLV
ncbi:MAG: hypothetical protein AAF514_22235 [Verrucomicrobiota bacterium]